MDRIKRFFKWMCLLTPLLYMIRVALYAWTSPRTWATGELVTASLMNTHVRDNLNALKEPPGSLVRLTSDLTTTSASLVDVSGASITLTTTGGDIYVSFHCSLYGGAAAVQIAVVLDAAVTVLAIQNILNSSGTPEAVSLSHKYEAPAAGSHTVKIRWLTTAGTATMYNTQANAVLVVGEFS